MNLFEIPIITYHKISDQKEFGITTISPQIFKKQMQLLFENGYKTITFHQINKNKELPDNPIIISFDDTYKSVYENAFPIMKNFGFIGVLFTISDYIGKQNTWEAYPVQRKFKHANREQILKMLDSGFEIGSHGKSHTYLPHLSNEAIKTELQESKIKLYNLFNTRIITLCYPFGGCNEYIKSIAKSFGYKFGVGNIAFNTDKNQYSLQRRSIYPTDSVNTFFQKVIHPGKINTNYLLEWLIQKGAYAGILKNKLF